MNWDGLPNGRLLAGLYLLAFVSMYAGVAWVLVAQSTGEPTIVGGIMFFAGLFGIIGLAWGLRNRVTAEPGRFMGKASGHQRAYQRLALGVELPRAWQALTG
ncbi:hypothetical protein [Kribbella swartbergensis]